MLKRSVWMLLALVAALPLFAAKPSRESGWKDDLVCATCHEQMSNRFRTTAHGKAMEFGTGAHDLTCASCHTGDLAKHVDQADLASIDKLGAASPAVIAEACLKCHASQRSTMYWRGSQHEAASVGCLSCHAIHKPGKGKLMARVTQAETCGACHARQRSQTMMRSTHLFRDERGTSRMECSTCHNPHGSQTAKLIDANSVNDKCYSCHQDKRGPFLWEHNPVKESCLNCHTAHGSNNERLLALRRPQLCQSCHAQQRHQSVVGRPNAMWNINRSCSNCHALIHGSNHPSGVNFNQ